MRKKLFAVAVLTAFVFSACGNRVEENNGNMPGGAVSPDTEVLTESDPLSANVAASNAPESAEFRTGSSKQDGSVAAVQDGNAGVLQVILPEGWTYDACPEGSDQLRVGDYGIHFYPEDASEGFIELCYADFFGVCGTGLEQKKVTLAGDEAYIGTYDHGDNWDFVSFHGANEGIVALTYAVEDWWTEYGEQVLEILDTACLKQDHMEGASSVSGTETGTTPASGFPADRNITTIACGTSQEPVDNSEEDLKENSRIEKLGLSLVVTECTNTGATLVFRQNGGSPTGELTFGEVYSIERWEDGEWGDVPVVITGNYAFNMPAYIIPLGGDREFQVDWEWLYGELDPGEYRIRKDVDDFRKSGDYDVYVIYAYFDIDS